MARINVEIAICTWNRVALLGKTLERLAQVCQAWETIAKWKVILVDNHSTDGTKSLAERYARQMEIKYVFEPQQGHVFARNKAIEVAEGDLMLWTDDDVLLDDNWLPAYVNAALEQAGESFWGGKISPVFPDGCPRWIQDNWSKVKGCFADRDLGDAVVGFDLKTLPYGANFAIRTKLQKKFLFNQAWGRSGTAVVGEDELDLFRRLLASGYSGCWVPGARVQHLIDSQRTTPEFVGRYFVGQGKTLAARNLGWSNDPIFLANEANHELFWYRMKRHFSRSEVWVSHLIRGSLAKGQQHVLEAQPTTHDRH